jgi:hypothetical protein
LRGAEIHSEAELYRGALHPPSPETRQRPANGSMMARAKWIPRTTKKSSQERRKAGKNSQKMGKTGFLLSCFPQKSSEGHSAM